MHLLKRTLRILFWGGFFCALAVTAIVFRVQTAFVNGGIVVPSPELRADTAMVLGASVLQNGTPSDALRDRLLVGVSLYKNGNVQRILLTGDDGSYHASEIEIMKRFTLEQGVPQEAILTDGQGYRTYESCKRAKEVFNLHDILVVTQRFHMSRALYLCNNLGLNAAGVTSDLQTYVKQRYFWLRDLAASVQAWWDINVWAPESPVAQ